jgi:membrane-anchored protein YejM (alkaline phosphatase superfamily)
MLYSTRYVVDHWERSVVSKDLAVMSLDVSFIVMLTYVFLRCRHQKKFSRHKRYQYLTT